MRFSLDKVTCCLHYCSTQALVRISGLFGLLAVLLLMVSSVKAGEEIRVVVDDPYIELHTGAGRGYPIFHVVDRHDWVVIIKRKHDWFKVRSSDDKVGWALIDQMQKTLTAPGVQARFSQVVKDHFGERSWEFGVMAGDFEGAAALTLYGGYNFNKNLSTDHFFTRVSGKFTNSWLLGFGLMSSPFPDWWFSPYFAIGGGYIQNAPRKSFVFAETTDSLLAYAGLGTRIYLSRRLFMRLEVKRNVVFIDDENNGDFLEIKGGFSFFF